VEFPFARHTCPGVTAAALGRAAVAVAVESGWDEGAASGRPAVELLLGVKLGQLLAVFGNVIHDLRRRREPDDLADDVKFDSLAAMRGAEGRVVHR